jgi:glycosyltransferase involved in cell wall biosynthesis
LFEKRQKRILFIAGNSNSTDKLIIDGIAKNGYDLFVLYIIYDRNCEKDFIFTSEKRNYHLIPMIFRENIFKIWKPIRWVHLQFKILYYASLIKPNIIFAQGIQTNGLGSILYKLFLNGRVRILLMPWGSDWAIIPYKSKFWMALTKFVLEHSDLYQIDCEYGKDTCLRLAKIKADNIWVFPQGIPLDDFQMINSLERINIKKELGIKSNKLVLIMTRYMKPIYGIDIFLKSLALLKKEYPGLFFAIICGDGPLRKELLNLSLELDITDEVLFTGLLKWNELKRYLGSSDVYVSTSYSDGTSISLLQAMAMGLPVIVTDVPANLEWVRDGYNGYIVERGNPIELKNAIINCIKNPDLLKMFGTRNRKIVEEKADWSMNLKKFLKMFELLSR